MVRLLNFIAHDDSRQFGELPHSISWYELRDHLTKLDGLEVTSFLTDHVTEVWIDFSFRDYTFTINNQFGDYWFFVSDPICPDEILEAVLSHCYQGLTRNSI